MTVFLLAALDVRYHLETYGVENLNARTLMLLREKLTKDCEPAMRFSLNFSKCSIPNSRHSSWNLQKPQIPLRKSTNNSALLTSLVQGQTLCSLRTNRCSEGGRDICALAPTCHCKLDFLVCAQSLPSTSPRLGGSV